MNICYPVRVVNYFNTDSQELFHLDVFSFYIRLVRLYSFIDLMYFTFFPSLIPLFYVQGVGRPARAH